MKTIKIELSNFDGFSLFPSYESPERVVFCSKGFDVIFPTHDVIKIEHYLDLFRKDEHMLVFSIFKISPFSFGPIPFLDELLEMEGEPVMTLRWMGEAGSEGFGTLMIFHQ